MNPPAHTPRFDRCVGVLWWILPVVCHFGFSWIGFNPTDDGWMQAVARRMLEGEVPHRDFIFVRPALSALLQVPLVWLGGEYTIWLSRLWGWLTLGAVTWLWSGFAQSGRNSPALRVMLYATAFFLSAHFFPVMAWHSLDGMLLCTIAVWFAARGTTGGLRAAFLCVGFAALCRQNFAVFGPVLLLAIPDRRKWVAMFWAALPPLAYAGLMLAAGAAPEFLQQVSSPGGAFRAVAWDGFIGRPLFLWAIPAGALAGSLVRQISARRPTTGPVLVSLIGLAVAAYAARQLWLGPPEFHGAAYALLGFTAGLALAAAFTGASFANRDRLVLGSGLGLAWVTAISIGWNSPALMAGVIVIVAWRATAAMTGAAPEAAATPLLLAALLSLLASGVAFRHARHTWPYRDAPPGELRFEAGPVFPGAAGLRTNERTFAVLRDLERLLDIYESRNQPYALLTDGAAVWIRRRQRNPLPCEWPQVTELGYDGRLIGRMTTAIRRLPADTRIVVQRVLVSELAYVVAGVPATFEYFPVQTWLRQHGRKLGETAFFEIYAPPAPVADAKIENK